MLFRPCNWEEIVLLLAVISPYSESSPHGTWQARSATHTAPQHYLPWASRREVIARKLGQGSSAAYPTCKEVVANASRGPIRIGFELFDVAGIDANKINLVKDKLMPRAINFLQGALQVYQATSPLRARRIERYAEDTMAPACGMDFGYRFADKYLSPASENDNFTEGEGVPNEDFHLFVHITEGIAGTARQCSNSREGLSAQAFATWCVKDQCDRPIFGQINFCSQGLSLREEDEDDLYYTTLHEIVHAMVFSSSLFQYFRNADGSPKVPRKPSDEDAFLSAVDWKCYNSENWDFPYSGGTRTWVPLTDDMIGTFTERGFKSEECACPVGKSTMESGCLVGGVDFRQPSCVMRLKMPTVLAEARAFFDCDTLGGAELENQDTGDSCEILASHWEQRVFAGELMCPVGTGLSPRYISRVTLGLFQDSGWYEADLSKADRPTKGIHWGYKQGCSFAVDKCVDQGNTKYPRHFCTSPGTLACSLDRKHVGECAELSEESRLADEQQFKYFQANTIAKRSSLDYCPVHTIALSNRICTSTASDTFPNAQHNLAREVFGTNSRCLESNFRGTVRKDGETFNPANYGRDFWSTPSPICYETECFDGGQKYAVKVADLESNDGKGTRIIGICSTEGQTLSAFCGMSGSITCAAPEEVCFDRRGDLASAETPIFLADSCSADIAWSPRLSLWTYLALVQVVFVALVR